VLAQEFIPDTPPSDAEPDQPDRVVDGRPPLYSFKRAIHPLTWLEQAPKQLFRSAESNDGWLHRMMTRKSDPKKTAGIKLGFDDSGTGSGFGPQVTFYNKNFLGKGIDIEVPLVYTYSRYERYRFSATVPIASERHPERLSFNLGADYASRARDDFFGIGNDSALGSEAQFRTITRRASAGFMTKLDETWTSSFHAVYRRVGVTEPLVGHSAQERFGDSIPGLLGSTTIRSAVFSVDHNTLEREDYAFKGGSDHFQISFNDSPRDSAFTYWQYRFDTLHLFPLTSDGRKVIAARGFVETNHTSNGHLVPFFDMPWIGSSSTFRGVENFRYRDKSAIALSLEYRYRIWPQMDWGFFVDEGQVGPQLGDFGWSRFHTGYGARLFFWLKPDFPISIDYGRSRETWRVYLNVNARF
jgi:outer membrane protein assembly factor BamA